MAEILLTNDYFLYGDSKGLPKLRHYVPLGILHLFPHLRKLGSDIDVIDTSFPYWEALIQQGSAFERVQA
jgi:hypothetical protein